MKEPVRIRYRAGTMCTWTCTDHSRRVILLTEHARRMPDECQTNARRMPDECQTNARRMPHTLQDFDVAIRTLNRTTLITRRTWHRCNRQRLTLSVFVVRKFRTDSVFIVQDTRETNTSLDLTQTDNAKNKLTQIENNT